MGTFGAGGSSSFSDWATDSKQSGRWMNDSVWIQAINEGLRTRMSGRHGTPPLDRLECRNVRCAKPERQRQKSGRLIPWRLHKEPSPALSRASMSGLGGDAGGVSRANFRACP